MRQRRRVKKFSPLTTFPIDVDIHDGYRVVATAISDSMGGITMNLHKRLTLMLCGTSLVCALAVTPTSRALAPTGQVAAGPLASAASKMGPMDINSATVDQLQTLPGIGAAYAKRIVAGRPYSSKNQLVTKGILPRSVYDRVQSRIVATHPKK